MNNYKNCGLTEEEVALLTTPFSQFRSAQERAMAFIVRDKYDDIISRKNSELKAIEKEKSKGETFAERIGTPAVWAKTVV